MKPSTCRVARPTPLSMSTTSDARDVHAKSETSAAEQQLQKRFQEAMRRRKQRHEQKDAIEPENIPDGDAVDDPGATQRAQSDTKTSVEGKAPRSRANDALELDGTKSKNPEEKMHREPLDDGKGEEAKSSSRRGQSAAVEDESVAERDARRRPNESAGRRQGKRRPEPQYYDDLYNDRYSWSNSYDDYDEETEFAEYERGYSPPPDPECDWETYRSTSILFPPLAENEKDDAPMRPKSIICSLLLGYIRKS